MAGLTPLSPDEAYYWVWSRALAPGYPDHPPMVALWIRIGTMLAGDNPLGVRLLGPLAAALGSWLLALAARDLLPEGPAGRGVERGTERGVERGVDRGIVAAGLLNCTLLFGVGAVTMTPDTPLLLFWTACLWALGRMLATGDRRWWLVAGAAGGLALDSKYTAALLAPAVLAWLLAVPSLRGWLVRWPPWAGLAVAAALFAPVLAWNAAHGWISVVRQGGRVGDWEPARALQFTAELLGGQLGFATPLLAVTLVAGSVMAARRAWAGERAAALLAACTAIPAMVFLQHALGDRVQANWPSVIYPGAALAAAGLGAGWRRWNLAGIVVGLAATLAVWLQAITGAAAIPMPYDPTLMRVGGWNALAADIAAVAAREHAAFVAADNYGQAAILARLLPRSLPVLGVDARWALFRLPDAAALVAGRDGILVRSARRADTPDTGDWSGIVRLADVARARHGMVAETERLYLVTGRSGAEPIVALPRPHQETRDAASDP